MTGFNGFKEAKRENQGIFRGYTEYYKEIQNLKSLNTDSEISEIEKNRE